MNITLYQCAEDVRAVLDAHFDSDTEAADTLEAVIGQFEIKAQSVIGYYKNIEAADAMLDAHIKQMQEKKKALSGRLKSLHEYLGRNMLAAGFKASFRKSKAIEILDEAQIPAEFMAEKITYTPNKTAIKSAIESGREVPGAKQVERQILQIK